MNKWFLVGLVGGTVFLVRDPARADEINKMPPAPSRHIKPVNVTPAPFKTVSGTITVRLDGVLVNAQDVTYIFSPEFDANSGSLKKMDQGTYFLKADNVPSDEPNALTIFATYNNAIKGRDGVIERRGQTYTGSVTIEVPYGEDFDFGVRFVDLQ